MVRRALDTGVESRRVLCLPLDLLEGQPPTALVESVNRALELAGGDAPRLILLQTIAAEGWPAAKPARGRGERRGAGLYRRYEPVERSAENMVAPERLHVWGRAGAARSTSSAGRARK